MNTKDQETLDILATKTRTITIGDLVVLVTEADWIAVWDFIEKLSEKATSILKADKDGTVSAKDKEELMKTIPDMIRSSRELMQQLLEISTNLPKDVKLPPRVIFKLVDVALEINLTEDVFSAGKDLAARLGALVPLLAKVRSAA